MVRSSRVDQPPVVFYLKTRGCRVCDKASPVSGVPVAGANAGSMLPEGVSEIYMRRRRQQPGSQAAVEWKYKPVNLGGSHKTHIEYGNGQQARTYVDRQIHWVVTYSLPYLLNDSAGSWERCSQMTMTMFRKDIIACLMCRFRGPRCAGSRRRRRSRSLRGPRASCGSRHAAKA